MLRFFRQLLTSYRATLWMLAVYAALLGIATFVEREHGSEIARRLLYFSPVLLLLQGLMCANIVGVTVTRWSYLRRRIAFLLLHFGYLVVLLGAAVTHATSKEGFVHLREGHATDAILNGRSEVVDHLPFTLKLEAFRMQRYPGSMSPRSYESDLTVLVDGEPFSASVSMNRVLDYEGYRFFQSSYDQDERGSILMVTQDELGRRITYIGYFILMVASILSVLGRNTRFRHLLRELRAYRAVAMLALGLALSANASADYIPDYKRIIDLDRSSGIPLQAGLNRVVRRAATYSTRPDGVGHEGPSSNSSEGHLLRLSTLPVQLRSGRVAPFSTFASQMLRKFTREEHFEGMSAVEVVDRILTNPGEWVGRRILLVDDDALRRDLGLSTPYASLDDLFADGKYTIRPKVEAAYRKPQTSRSAVDRDLLKLDERVNLLRRLMGADLLAIFPDGRDSVHHQWYAPGEELRMLDSSQQAEVQKLWNGYVRAAQAGYTQGNWLESDVALDAILAYQQSNLAGLPPVAEQVVLEESYNRWQPERRAKICYLIFGFLLMLLMLAQWLFERFIYAPRVRLVASSPQLPKRVAFAFRFLRWAMRAGFAVGIIFQIAGLAMRWMIGGYAPWSNSYETMVALALFIALVGVAVARYSPLLLPLSSLLAGVVLFVSGLSWMDPQITPLVPVLQSPWLMFHVAVLMVAYGFLGVSSVVGAAYLLARGTASQPPAGERARGGELILIVELTELLGLLLMSVGVFLGAVWANESWGRYWSWDPKETWALITCLTYALLLHWRWFSGRGRSMLYAFMSQWAILVVMMTYWGVNYLLSGMHSYGSAGGLSLIPVWVYLGVGAYFLLPGAVVLLLRRRG